MKAVSADEFCNFKFVSGIKFSPEGKNICFVVSEADKEKNTYNSYIYKKDGKKAVKLTNGGKEGEFIFIDEDTVLFAGDRDNNKEPSLESKFYKISLNGGEAEKAFTFPIPVSEIYQLKNGDFIMMGSTFPGFEDLYKGDKKLAKMYLDKKKEDEDYEVVEENPWWWNGGTYTRGVYNSLFYYDKKKKSLKQLTEEGLSVNGFEVTKDEKSIYFYGMPKKKYTSYDEISLYKVDIETTKISSIFEGGGNYILYNLCLGDSFAVLMLSDRNKMGGNSNPDFFKLDYKTDKYTMYAKFGEAIGSSVGSDVRYGGGYFAKMWKDTLYFIATLFDGAYLMKLENGIVSKVIDKEGSVDCFDIHENKVVLSALWDMKAPELYDGNAKQLSHFNDRILKGKYVASPEKCFASNAGHEVHGFVLKPINFDASKKYPVILDIHGGPKTVYGEVYYHEMQYWAGKGYFVIFCNPTGSDGRGDDFANICGKYGTVDFDDIMAFTDKALATYPQMDASRLYETGGSYGGFMTNWIIGHTNRFKAVATQRSISNWFSFYGVSDIGVCFTLDQNLANPWNNPEKLWEHSPMKYFDNITTPTLVLHSLEDYRCPVDQGYQLYTSLCERGIDSKMVLFKGENHDLSRTGKPKHRIRRLNEITSWFETH